VKRRRAPGRGRDGQPAGRHTVEYVQQQPPVIHGQPNRDGRYPLGDPGREAGNELDERGGNDRYATTREAAA
jgi:hypothetical protein